MKKARIFVVFVILFTFTASGLFAQSNAQELNFGARTSGSLKQNSEVWYRITPNQNSFMVIELYSNDFDTYIEVYDTNHNLLAYNDDSGEGTDSKLEMFSASGTTYLIKVRSYDEYESGSYTIMASYKPIPQATELRFGTPRTVNFNRDDEHWYSIRTTRAGIVIVETSGDDIDTILEAYNSTYMFIDSDDDSGEDLNARVLFTVEPNQTYLIKLRSYNSSATGRYQIIARMYVEAN